ncbi:MAG: HAD-IA family hydrolase [Thermodesulfobacteriota bacterium]|nr:HAD-IA family hydrolase [Thermodesulfobacteriota bacterium]
MNNIKAVVFDCDGVMFDSQQANIAFYNRVLDYFGEPAVTPSQSERVHLCHTASSPQVFAGLLGSARVEAALDFSQQLGYEQFIPQLQAEPGLFDALAQLSAHFSLAVATNRGSSMAKILDFFDMDGSFHHVLTYLDVARAKPCPDMLYAVAERLHLAPDQMMFVGDSEFDRRAAKSAGCHFVSYKWDGGLRIDHHSQLAQLLQL